MIQPSLGQTKEILDRVVIVGSKGGFSLLEYLDNFFLFKFQLQLATTNIDEEKPVLRNIFRSSVTTTQHTIQSLRHSRNDVVK